MEIGQIIYFIKYQLININNKIKARSKSLLALLPLQQWISTPDEKDLWEAS